MVNVTSGYIDVVVYSNCLAVLMQPTYYIYTFESIRSEYKSFVVTISIYL